MKKAGMISDITRSLFQRPVTERYPFERLHETPAQLRGKLVWNPEKCTGCGLCDKDCPSQALELITLDKKAKKFLIRYHVDRCTFCAQCVQNCRFDCLDLSEEFELAALGRQPFEIYYGKEEDIKAFLEKIDGGPAAS